MTEFLGGSDLRARDAFEGSSAVLEVEDLNVRFPTDDGVVHAVRGVSYQLRPGEVLGIVGESGSGKSVTSLAVMGLLPRTARITGSVKFRGRELIGLGDREMSGVRGRGVSMVFQDPMTSLNPVYKIGAQLAEALQTHDRGMSDRNAGRRSVELLDLVGIPNAKDRVDQFPHEFSGGMRQRVVIAIAMANAPDVIIADEPTTALDVTVQAQVLETLRTAQAETKASMVLITHDLGVVAGMADRVLVMYAGKPVETGDVDDIYYRPRMPYTVGLLGSLPRVDRGERQRLTPIHGSPPSLLNLPPGCPFTPRCPMSQDKCETVEPTLDPVDGVEHYSACHFSADLVRKDAVPQDIFNADSVDDTGPEMPAADAEGASQ
ncbi:MAG TPA: ABC transporter ATP-binding protein [Mycobacteriales bacterium]|jgi:peptide/nickel transport system ATP-binding protein|nr:ABC transporter ATP-binding protein [Mycobacteriales bacterium]